MSAIMADIHSCRLTIQANTAINDALRLCRTSLISKLQLPPVQQALLPSTLLSYPNELSIWSPEESLRALPGMTGASLRTLDGAMKAYTDKIWSTITKELVPEKTAFSPKTVKKGSKSKL